MWALFKTYLKNRSESELILVLIFRLLAVLYSQDSPTLVCHAHSLLAYSSIFPFYTKLDREKYIVQGTDLLVLVSEKQFLLNHQVLLQLFSQLLGLWCDIHLVCQIPNDEGGFSWAPCHACSQTDIFLNGFVKQTSAENIAFSVLEQVIFWDYFGNIPIFSQDFSYWRK